MISHMLAKLYGIILEKKINIWLKSEGKQVLEDNTQQWTTLLCLGSLWRNVVMINSFSYVALWALERFLIRYLEITSGID